MPRRLFARSVVTAALALSASSLLSADTYPRQPGIKILNYTFDITLSDASDEFVVVDTVDLQFVSAGVTTVELDLCKFSAQPRSGTMADGFADPCAEPRPSGRGAGAGGAAPVAPKGGKGMTVTSVKAGEQTLSFTHENDRVKVTLPRASVAGDKFSFTLNYHGVPATGILIAPNKYGDRSFVSDPWPNKARNVRAVVDHPSMKATVTTRVTAPRHYQVISNGLMTQEVDLPNNTRRTTWKESVPICTWLMSLAVGPYAVDHFGSYRGIAMSSWVYPQEHEVSFNAFRAHTQNVLEFFIDRIGPYSYEKLAHVQANGVGGGMELASSIFYGYGAQGPGRQLIAHEMAHQWFGDAATEKDWDDVWLSEGFATYFALLYSEFQDGKDAFIDGVKRSKTTALNYAINNPTSTIVHNNLADISKVIANNAQVYQGGAQVLHNIRGVVGTENFWSAIRLYYSRYQDSNATTDDLRRAFEETCVSAGTSCPADGKDLRWLFTQLLNRGGALQVAATWSYDAAAKQITVAMDQTQTTGLYRMPLEIVVSTTGANGQTTSQTHTVTLTDKSQSFSLPAGAEPTAVALDPNAWAMMRATLARK